MLSKCSCIRFVETVIQHCICYGNYLKVWPNIFSRKTTVLMVCLNVSAIIQPVQAVVNVSLTIPPVGYGGGAKLTCSWTNLANVRTVEYKRLSTKEVVYTYDTASNVGSGILSWSVGWMETDKFIFYINVTMESQFATYECHVTNDEGSYKSPSSNLDIAGK